MSTHRTITVTAVLAMAAGMLLAACGDDAEALTKEEFVARADAVCEETNGEIDAVFEAVYADLDETVETPDQEIAARFETAFDEVGPLFHRQIDEIRALTPPAEDADKIDALLDDLEAAVEELTTTVAAAADGDEDALAEMNSDDDPFTDVDNRAIAYGFDVCGSPD